MLLRRWRAEDEREMARINREPEVARYLNRPVDEAAIAGFYAVICAHWERHGFGPWALESLEPERSRSVSRVRGPGVRPVVFVGCGFGA